MRRNSSVNTVFVVLAVTLGIVIAPSDVVAEDDLSKLPTKSYTAITQTMLDTIIKPATNEGRLQHIAQAPCLVRQIP